MTARSDYRVNPITGATSWRTMDQETKTVAQLSAFLPGIYGFRLQDRINTASITVVEAVTGGATWTRVSTSPAAGQYFADTETGLVIFNITDSGKTFYVNYQGGGSIADIGALEELVSQIYPPGHIYGLTLSNNGTDPTNDIDIAAGSARDSTDTANMLLSSALTKRLDATWALGTNQGGRFSGAGAIADGTWHVFLLKSDSTGTVDVGFDTSASGANAPSGYYKRRIGSIIRSSGVILAFVQEGDVFTLDDSILDVNVGNIGAASNSRTLTVPTGIRVHAILDVMVYDGGAYLFVGISDLDNNAPTLSATSYTASAGASSGIGNYTGNRVIVRTNTSGQIRQNNDTTTINTQIAIRTLGWIDKRGQ